MNTEWEWAEASGERRPAGMNGEAAKPRSPGRPTQAQAESDCGWAARLRGCEACEARDGRPDLVIVAISPSIPISSTETTVYHRTPYSLVQTKHLRPYDGAIRSCNRDLTIELRGPLRPVTTDISTGNNAAIIINSLVPRLPTLI